MKVRFFSSLRWKIIFVFLFSIGLSFLSVFVLLGIAAILSGIDVVRAFLMPIYNSFGVFLPAIAVGLFLFFLYFFLLTQKSIRYLVEINKALQGIARGLFDTQIPIRSSDEFGQLADNINSMTLQLKESIEEERNAEKTKNELVTSVSHDLRTPLTSILGYLELIDKDQYRDEVELRYYVNIAYHKSQRLKKLIDELFEFTRVSYGGMKVKLQRVDLGQLLEQLAEEFYPVFHQAGMEYRISLPKEKVYVSADGDLMVRVFENLLSNAIRYGKSGKFIDIRLECEENQAISSISNYGEPISEQDLPYIFEKFYRVESSRSEETGGTGLGLAISKNIVEQHGGSIQAYNRDQKTIFEVRLNIS